MAIRVLLITAALFIVGCQTTVVSNNEICAARDLASNQCAHVFQEFTPPLVPARVPSEAELKTFFDSLSDYGWKPWDIIEKFEFGYTANLGTYQKPVRLAEILAQRRKENDQTAKIMVKDFGYREHKGYLMPPRNYPKLLHKIIAKIMESAKQNGVPEDQVILPAFIFSKGQKFRALIRPGIDELPPLNNDWKIETGDSEVPVHVFSKMIRSGKMPLTPGMFFHDIGHFIDYIERPKYMPAYRNFLEARDKFMTALDKPDAYKEADKKYVKIVRQNIFERYLNEWIYLPDARNADKIEKILLPRAHETKFNEFEDKYSKLEFSKLISLSKLYIKNWNTLFSRHGGGARDMSTERTHKYEALLDALRDLSSGESTYVQKQKQGFTAHDILYRVNEAPYMRLKLEALLTVLQTGEATPELQQIILSSRAKGELVDKAAFLLGRQLAEIEFRVRTSLDLKMTPEQIATDLALLFKENGWKEYQLTPTYRFYATYREGSLQRYSNFEVAPPQEKNAE